MTLWKGYIEWHFFPKIGTLVIPKLWTFISSSNQACLEHMKVIFYSLQKDLCNGVLHALIINHLTPNLRGFVVGSQILNLILNPSFDHNSCIWGLNEQWEGTLGIYTLMFFQWYLGGPISCLFAFSTNVLNFWDFRMNVAPKVRVHLGSISCTLRHFWECVSFFNTLFWPYVPLHFTLIQELDIVVMTSRIWKRGWFI